MSYGIEEIDLLFDVYEENNAKTFENFEKEMKNVRAGRANPHLLDKIQVDYYGVPSPLNNIANISVPEARLLVIAPWDKSTLKGIEKAILAANIGLTPNNDGQVIRLVFPELTEERRKQTCKEIKNTAEETKIVLRNHRREILDELKKMQKASDITEDDLKAYTTDVDKILADIIDKVDQGLKKKEEEVLAV